MKTLPRLHHKQPTHESRRAGDTLSIVLQSLIRATGNSDALQLTLFLNPSACCNPSFGLQAIPTAHVLLGIISGMVLQSLIRATGYSDIELAELLFQRFQSFNPTFGLQA